VTRNAAGRLEGSIPLARFETMAAALPRMGEGILPFIFRVASRSIWRWCWSMWCSQNMPQAIEGTTQFTVYDVEARRS
jgi:hypothetical protein